MQSWATVENKSRNVGTGRSAVGAAVTGHNKAKVKTGGGSLRSGQLAATSSAFSGPSHPRKLLRAVPSVLAGVADRSARFEQC
jgi:mediator of replication checkpoint protein 1